MATARWSAGVRRTAAALLVASVALSGCASRVGPGAPTATAGGEQFEGTMGTRQPGVAIFRGIPYATPPLGALRWQAPAPHRPAAGRHAATRFAPGCFQDAYNTDWYRKVGATFGVPADSFSDPPFSEDCLYLNVWTPELDPRAALPVIVWIHGGANRGGWSFEPNYDGEQLAARGHVVVVTIAYRLGVFGYFGHPQLRGSAAPANFGLLDQIAALHWVRDEIGAFGGDPANVTVAGESAGAEAVGYLAASPLAAGLFRRAISESGGFQMREDLTLANAERVGLEVAAALPGRPDLAGLRALPSQAVFDAAARALPGHDYAAVVDGRSLTMAPATYYRREGLAADLLVGTNEDEWYMYVDEDPAQLRQAVDALPPAAREPLAARAAAEPSVRRGRDKLFSLPEMTCPAYAMAAAAAVHRHRAFVYRFTRVRPGPGGAKLLAYHGAEIPYVFDTHDAWLTRDGDDVRLTDAMLAYWSNFARSGDPNGAGLVPWPAFDDADARVQELGTRIGPLVAPDKALCDRLAASLYPGWAPGLPAH